MTQPPNVRGTPVEQGSVRSRVPGQPGAGSHTCGAVVPGGTAVAVPGHGGGPPPVSPPAPAAPASGDGRRAWSEGWSRLCTAATTEPGRLRTIGALLAAVIVAFGAVTAWEVSARASAADDVVGRSQPLSSDAAAVYRSLADADTAASSGFLAGVDEPPAVRERYEKDIALAARLLVEAASTTDGSSASDRQIATLNEGLPRYYGLIERARANNRLGKPLGGAYLRFANEQMSKELLPAAQRLYEAETARLDRDQDAARGRPYAAIALGLLALAALGWAQRRLHLRTNRVFNRGLLAATAATAAVLLWLAVGHTVARTQLQEARIHGQESLTVLSDARINSLKARANENLTLVARGAVLTNDGKSDKYETDYATGMRLLRSGLSQAQRLADDAAGRDPVASAAASAAEWRTRHEQAGAKDRAGDYDGALEKVIGSEGSTGAAFDRVDESLEQALAHEEREFTRAAQDGRGALSGLPAGAGVLTALGAGAAVLGIGRRLLEYR
ncbi:hypothetical protein [Streptomyces sp. MUM 178J]|uniref:hypothetical protein n=1 Tax=Streptomyces sp. MUM 178J TaxID=2791991 RepID=UPI001F04FFDE|nr:hypothetical protein [Streptomyces sp. MUM 178J]WRQ79464.1 hypothetical protein I3F59_008860 [Streptomyces sp. MUM 178J]